MFTIADYHALLARILDPSQPSYTYLSTHRDACICVIDVAPPRMSSSLASKLLKSALSEPVTTERPGIYGDIEWRYDLANRALSNPKLVHAWINEFLELVKHDRKYLGWLSRLCRQSNRYLSIGEVTKIVQASQVGVPGSENDLAAIRSFIASHVEPEDREAFEPTLAAKLRDAERAHAKYLYDITPG